MKIGLVGSDSSHTDKVVARWGGRHELLLAEGHRPPGELNIAPEVAASITVVDNVADLIGRVDGALVGHRLGSEHRAAAVTLLEAGIPVFVDKPLAGNLGDAEAIVAAAERGGAPVSSWSALRWSSVATLASRLDITRLLIEGPADPESPFGGIAFYAVHCADLAVALLGGRVRDIAVRFEDDLVVTDVAVGGRRATLVLTPPAAARGFRLVAESRTQTVDRPIELKHDYMNPIADIAEELFATRVAMQTRDELLDVVRITDAMNAAVAARRGNHP